MSISVQAWMDRLRQRVQEGSIVFNPVSGSDFFRRLYMNQPPPAVAVRMEARREPIPLTDMEREECRRIGERLARMMDQQLIDAFNGTLSNTRIEVREGQLRAVPISDEELYRPFSDGSRRPYVPFTPLPTCAQCGKTGLKQTYTSTRDQREICADCFEGLQDKGLAREQGQPMKKKARHPLDAWMDQ